MMHTRAFATLVFALAAAPLPAQVGRSAALLDPNVATEAELAAVPGFSPAIAKDALAARPFLRPAAFDAFLAGKGLTAEQRAAAYARVFLHLDLNDATDAEIELIPGVGARMLREFKEYRPYRGLAQFRREIGKYVNAAELDRLTGYVYVRMDLNAASDEDLRTIPGLGPRMLREFKEYRPYDGLPRFRKEIGKYVNEKEVARLERYVKIGN
jgi:DNA uptake protein ComE-like DNA-binding protein